MTIQQPKYNGGQSVQVRGVHRRVQWTNWKQGVPHYTVLVPTGRLDSNKQPYMTTLCVPESEVSEYGQPS